jgi:hypothetical protein
MFNLLGLSRVIEMDVDMKKLTGSKPKVGGEEKRSEKRYPRFEW